MLEPAIGSARFAALVAELLLISQALLTLAAAGLSAVAPALFAGSYRSTCAVGFSGVLFALKVAAVVARCGTGLRAPAGSPEGVGAQGQHIFVAARV